MLANILMPLFIIKAMEPGRNTRDAAAGAMFGAAISGNPVIGGMLGRTILDRVRPMDDTPAPIGKPDTQPNAGSGAIVVQSSAVDKLVARVESALDAASQVLLQDKDKLAGKEADKVRADALAAAAKSFTANAPTAS